MPFSLRSLHTVAALSLLAMPALGQSAANVVRFDVLAPIGLNFGYNLFADKEVLFPILVSYERRISGGWSVGLEGLVNGGVPDEKLSGATLSTRYYWRHDGSLSGLYAAPQLAYRRVTGTEVLNNTVVPNVVVTRGNRLGLGLLVGWQQPVGKSRRVLLDYALGGMHWTTVGTDGITGSLPPPYPAGTYEGNNRVGWWLDGRLGVGYQF